MYLPDKYKPVIKNEVDITIKWPRDIICAKILSAGGNWFWSLEKKNVCTILVFLLIILFFSICSCINSYNTIVTERVFPFLIISVMTVS